jgi:5-amino-6-(5-phosphoribosylamino)uracil reductase
MPLQIGYNASEDTFPLPSHIKKLYGPFGLPAPADSTRPYVTSNFVMGLDGRVSFREVDNFTGARIVSRSTEDRWLMDFFRAHHHAVLIGASTLREERGPDGLGWDFGIQDDELRGYRDKALGLAQLKVIVLTGSGNIDANYHLFNSPRVEPWFITSPQGEEQIRFQLARSHRDIAPRIITGGCGNEVDLPRALQQLRQEHGVHTLLCEGGPTLYGQLIEKHLVDEEFRTISLQVLGESTDARIERLTAYGHSSFTPERAPWFRLISIHYALPYHAFLRVRYEGPRNLDR